MSFDRDATTRPVIRYRPGVARPKRMPARRRPGRSAATDDYVVTDDLPSALPIVAAEVAVVETYLRDLVDRLFAGLDQQT